MNIKQLDEICRKTLERVKNTPEPQGQKFHVGSRVKITDHLESYMSHFPSGKAATVLYTYAHAFGGNDIKNYCLNVDGIGQVSWYFEHQLELIDQ